MTPEEKGTVVRCMATAVVIAEYKLLQLKDDSRFDLKQRVGEAIKGCKRVQDWFIHHPEAKGQTKIDFVNAFFGNEIFLLSEILELCFGMDEEGLEEVIRALKEAQLKPINSEDETKD